MFVLVLGSTDVSVSFSIFKVYVCLDLIVERAHGQSSCFFSQTDFRSEDV